MTGIDLLIIIILCLYEWVYFDERISKIPGDQNNCLSSPDNIVPKLVEIALLLDLEKIYVVACEVKPHNFLHFG